MSNQPSVSPPTEPRVRTRRVEPVSEEFSPDEIFDPESEARPGLAAWLLLGPVLSVVGVLGWLRLVAGVPLPLEAGVDWAGLAFDLFLLALFILPHSLLARGFGRRWLNKPAGPAAERPLYVLVAGATLTLLGFGWATSGPILWDHGGLIEIACRAVQILGGIVVAWAVVVSSPSILLGLSQIRCLESGRQPPQAELVALPPYRFLRQPMNLGVLLILAGMPEATLDRALLLVCFAVWILIAAPWEERDAHVEFGQAYDHYRERTPRWIPRLRRPMDS